MSGGKTTSSKHESISDKNAHKAFPEYLSHTRPFLKWAGGKRKLLSKFQNLYPEELKNRKIKNYFEPFLGSGAVFLDIVQKYSIENAYLYDINEELILTYMVVQKDVLKLIEQLDKYSKAYLKLDREQITTYYYGLRWQFNKQRKSMDFDNYSEKWIKRAAQIIFLNKTCYNGLFRVNSKGEFNSAAGDYENPRICDPENLLNVSRILRMAEIRKSSFDILEREIKHSSFVYFDPPYRPISKSSCFTAYSAGRFNDDEQIKLSSLFYRLHRQGTRLMLSNSDPKNSDPKDDFFEELYSGFNIQRIPVPRFINSKADKRGCVSEIIITNYK